MRVYDVKNWRSFFCRRRIGYEFNIDAEIPRDKEELCDAQLIGLSLITFDVTTIWLQVLSHSRCWYFERRFSFGPFGIIALTGLRLCVESCQYWTKQDTSKKEHKRTNWKNLSTRLPWKDRAKKQWICGHLCAPGWVDTVRDTCQERVASEISQQSEQPTTHCPPVPFNLLRQGSGLFQVKSTQKRRLCPLPQNFWIHIIFFHQKVSHCDTVRFQYPQRASNTTVALWIIFSWAMVMSFKHSCGTKLDGVRCRFSYTGEIVHYLLQLISFHRFLRCKMLTHACGPSVRKKLHFSWRAYEGNMDIVLVTLISYFTDLSLYKIYKSTGFLGLKSTKQLVWWIWPHQLMLWIWLHQLVKPAVKFANTRKWEICALENWCLFPEKMWGVVV